MKEKVIFESEKFYLPLFKKEAQIVYAKYEDSIILELIKIGSETYFFDLKGDLLTTPKSLAEPGMPFGFLPFSVFLQMYNFMNSLPKDTAFFTGRELLEKPPS
jgi:hypothetical protein